MTPNVASRAPVGLPCGRGGAVVSSCGFTHGTSRAHAQVHASMCGNKPKQ
jgi:hypothetical protein